MKTMVNQMNVFRDWIDAMEIFSKLLLTSIQSPTNKQIHNANMPTKMLTRCSVGTVCGLFVHSIFFKWMHDYGVSTMSIGQQFLQKYRDKAVKK